MHISGLHLYAFPSPNLNFYACRSKMLNVTLIHRTNIRADEIMRNGLLRMVADEKPRAYCEYALACYSTEISATNLVLTAHNH